MRYGDEEVFGWQKKAVVEGRPPSFRTPYENRLLIPLNKQSNSDLWFLGLQFWVSYYLYKFILSISPKGAVLNSPGYRPGGYVIQYNISTKGA